MDVNIYQYVVKIYETRSFSQAAKALYIGQPALSQSIKRLEKQLGITLFVRTTTYVKPTEACEIFVEQAKNILAQIDCLNAAMQSYSSQTPEKIVLGISQFYGKYFLPYVMKILHEAFPHTPIEIKESESKIVEKSIETKEVDLGIIPLPIHSPSVCYEKIYDEELVFALPASHLPTVQRNSQGQLSNLSSFQDCPFLLLQQDFKLRKMAESICAEAGFMPQVVFESENLDILNSMVAHDGGVTFLPQMIEPRINVSYLPLATPLRFRKIVLATSVEKASLYSLSTLADTIHSHLMTQMS